MNEKRRSMKKISQKKLRTLESQRRLRNLLEKRDLHLLHLK
jgi:hypothetical protein